MNDPASRVARRHHDVGGNPAAAGRIELAEKADQHWQVAFTATLWALIGGESPRMALDEMRRGVEDMAPEDYDAMPYYDRQTLAVTRAMVERGYLTWAEIEARIAELGDRR